LLCLVALLAAGILVIACNTADPSECFPNTGDGFGGSGTIPIGAGVGVGSGDFISPPRFGPLGYPASANPCVTPSGDPSQGGDPPPAGDATGAGAGGAGGAAGMTNPDKEACIDNYVRCQLAKWQGPCSDCLHKCITQGEWDFRICHPQVKCPSSANCSG